RPGHPGRPRRRREPGGGQGAAWQQGGRHGAGGEDIGHRVGARRRARAGRVEAGGQGRGGVMSVQAYDKGDRVQFTAAFTNLAGAAADPTTVRFKVKRPDLTETTWVYGTDAQVVRDGVGAYHA